MGAFPFNWTGKIIGAAIGLAKGGLMGAFIGGLVGHWVDQWLVGRRQNQALQQHFSDTLFACMGYLARADGRVSEAEIAVTEHWFQRMKLDADGRRRAIEHFNRGKREGFSLHREMLPFYRLTMFRPDLRRLFMEILLQVAFSDGAINQAEQVILAHLAEELHIPAYQLEQMVAAYRNRTAGAGQGGHGGGRAVSQAGPDPWTVLGLSPDASEAQIKRAYRRLMSQYHPDKLVAQGLPPEMVEVARSKAQDINAAYDRIKAQKGIR